MIEMGIEWTIENATFYTNRTPIEQLCHNTRHSRSLIKQTTTDYLSSMQSNTINE